MLNKILNLFKKPVVQIDQVNDKTKTVNREPVNPQITDAVTQVGPEKSQQAKVVEAAVKEKIVKPNVKAKADVQTAKKTRVKKPQQ